MYPFALMTVISLYLTCKAKKMGTNQILVWCILTLSMIWFVYYNWDIVAIGFTAAAIYFRAVNRTKLSGLFLGLGTATKLVPIILLPVFMQEEKKWTKRFQVAAITLGTFLVFNLPFIICNFNNWFEIYAHTARWGIEDAFWLYVFGPSGASLSKVSFALLFLFFTIVVLTRKMGFLHVLGNDGGIFIKHLYVPASVQPFPSASLHTCVRGVFTRLLYFRNGQRLDHNFLV